MVAWDIWSRLPLASPTLSTCPAAIRDGRFLHSAHADACVLCVAVCLRDLRVGQSFPRPQGFDWAVGRRCYFVPALGGTQIILPAGNHDTQMMLRLYPPHPCRLGWGRRWVSEALTTVVSWPGRGISLPPRMYHMHIIAAGRKSPLATADGN